MSLAFFYKENIDQASPVILLDEDTSKHIVQVLRMKNGDQLNLTDGLGNLFTTVITDDHKKRCTVNILSTHYHKLPEKKISIAISLIKSASRFEWFLEKATEIGVSEIIPLICDRTEKQHFRFERMKGILISAMLQSQQCWLPVLHEPVKFGNLVARQFDDCEKYIAHCLPGDNKAQLHQPIIQSSNQLILIGPEGDFTEAEIRDALAYNFIPVSLGNTRLRTETAGIFAAVMLSFSY